MAGLTRPIVDLIEAPGLSSDTDVVVADERLRVETPREASVSELDFGHYDPIQGVLRLQLHNGEQVTIKGFPTADKIPVGPTGPQGQRGQDGKPGKPGKDGEQGDPGCEGPQGVRGQTGPRGKDGRIGMQGPPGIRGMTGPMGPMGPKGLIGDMGPIGPTGPRGDPGPPGPPGAPGAQGTVNIIVSATDPGPVGAGALWVNPNASVTQQSDPAPGSVSWP